MRREESKTASPKRNREVLYINESRKAFLKCNGEPGLGYIVSSRLALAKQ